jgi:hypothetical protein
LKRAGVKLKPEPSIGASHQVSVHLAKQFQRRFLEITLTRNKNCLWQPCLLTDRDESSNLYKEPSIDALLWNCLAKWTETWWEAPMEGSGFSFTPARFKSCLVFFKFLPIYSKPFLLQHLRSNSFKKISTISCEDAVVGFFLSGSHAQIPYLQQCKVKSRNQGT